VESGLAENIRERHSLQKPCPHWSRSGTLSSSLYRVWHTEQHGTFIFLSLSRVFPESLNRSEGHPAGGLAKFALQKILLEKEMADP
jgi:hypothetical protein